MLDGRFDALNESNRLIELLRVDELTLLRLPPEGHRDPRHVGAKRAVFAVRRVVRASARVLENPVVEAHARASTKDVPHSVQ
jgi:hypothetical protein